MSARPDAYRAPLDRAREHSLEWLASLATRPIPPRASADEATAAGIHSAFVYGAIISLLAIPAAFFIRRPANADAVEGVPIGH